MKKSITALNQLILEGEEIVKRNIDSFETKNELRTYYLDELFNDTFLVSVDDFLMNVYNTELQAEKVFECFRVKYA